MVVARQWAEQRVLMRAFTACEDQTRPTINLYGQELSIGPAGVDPHGEWGIHVDPPIDGKAQQLREALQLAAKLLAGSKGNPPRLEDETSEFDERATNHWAPSARAQRDSAPPEFAAAASPPLSSHQLRKTPPAWRHEYDSPPLQKGGYAAPPVAPLKSLRRTFHYSGAAPTQPVSSSAASVPAPAQIPSGQPHAGQPHAGQPLAVQTPPAKKRAPAKTVHGFSRAKSDRDSYAILANKTMPLGFVLEDDERTVINTLAETPSLSARQIGDLLQISNPMPWMAKLMDKLADFGLDLIAPGEDRHGEPTYVLTR